MPDYADYFDELERTKLQFHISPALLMETSRGCWWGQKSHCTFCGISDLNMGFRSKSPKKVLHEIKSLVRKYKINVVSLVDNILDLKYFDTVFPKLRKKKINLSMFAEVKANLTRRQVRHLKETGFQKIQPGIESLSTHVLKLMRKGTTALQNVLLLRWCKEQGIKVLWNMLYGFPGEGKNDYEDILSMVQNISHLEPPEGPNRVRIERFSPYHFDSEKFNIRWKRPMSCYKFLYPDHVDLVKLANFFDYTIDNAEIDPEEEMSPIRNFVVRWRSAHKMDPFLVYALGPNHITFYDYRMDKEFGAIPEFKIYKYEGLAAKIYDFCMTVRTYESILKLAEKHNRPRETNFETKIRGILNEFIARGLMCSENDRFLSIAVDFRYLSYSERRRLDGFIDAQMIAYDPLLNPALRNPRVDINRNMPSKEQKYAISV
jgi:ribosomal peptide maturation radical SAM protein 1